MAIDVEVADPPSSVQVPDLQALIENAGIRQSRIARELNVDPSTPNRWAFGLRLVPTKYQPRLGELLGVEFVIIGDEARVLSDDRRTVKLVDRSVSTPGPPPVV